MIGAAAFDRVDAHGLEGRIARDGELELDLFGFDYNPIEYK